MAIDAGNVALGQAAGGGFGSLVGGVASLLGAGGKGGDRERKKAVQAWEKLKAVDFDLSQIPAPDLKVLQENRPDLVEMVLPLQTEDVQDSLGMRNAQMGSLSTYERLRDEGMPVAERGAVLGAQRAMSTQAQRADDAVIRDLAERGRMGGGDEAALRMLATQQQSDLAGQYGQQLAEQTEANRLAGAQGAAQLAGTIRGQDTDLALKNRAAKQNYNELVASILNSGAMANQAARQQSQAYNVGMKNQTGIQKEILKTQTAQSNLANKNAMKQQGYDNELSRLKGYTGALTGVAESEDEKRKNRIKSIYDIGSGVGSTAGTIGGAVL
jgi:hypothetical protein